MRSCSILISNYNSFETIQLCIESIKKYTKYPYKILVYDDASTNGVDLQYLRDKANKEWINLIEGDLRLNHGGALNQLLTRCKTDLAVILDNDIQILESGWLEVAVSLMREKVLGLCTIEYGYKSHQLSYPDWFQTWFMMLNMQAYRDGMEIDWNRVNENKNIEPYKSLMKNDDRFDRFNSIMLPPGTKLLMKLMYNNPKSYELISPVPGHIKMKYRHYVHISSTATESPDDTPAFRKIREDKFAIIKNELKKLRSQ